MPECVYNEKVIPTINLDELQQEAEMLVALLKDRQPGLYTWNFMLAEKLKSLHTITSQALSE